MQRVHLSHAEREWLVAHANVPDPLRLELIALAMTEEDTDIDFTLSVASMAALDGVFLASGDVYRSKMSDGFLVSTLAHKVWAALLRERADEIAPIWREGFGDARATDQDGCAAADDAGREAGVQSGSGARAAYDMSAAAD